MLKWRSQRAKSNSVQQKHPRMKNAKIILEQAKKETDIREAFNLLIDLMISEFEHEKDKMETYDKLLFGNGDPTKSILSRLDRLETNLSNAVKVLYAVGVAILIEIVMRIIKLI